MYMHGNICAKHTRRADKITSWIFLLPALIIVLLVVVYPLLNSILLSLKSVRLNIAQYEHKFVGLENYVQMFRDNDFGITVKSTFIFALVSVLCECVLGTVAAMMFAGDGHIPRFLRSFMLIPMIIAPVVSGNLWRMMLDKSTGIINYGLTLLSLPPVNWLGNAKLAMLSIIFVDVWRMMPWVALLLISGIKAIPYDTIEAAIVDGVTKWQNFIFIVLPQLYKIFILVLMIRTIDAFKVFDVVYVMTSGGPGRATEMLPNYIYTQGLRYFNAGYAAALAISFLLAMACLALVFLLLRRAKKD
ncbi:ABC transporter, permease protein [Treponema lecithinolyticum ATCC 700332]|uniref:ABC transporter, permease protein n=2 Tax=Treponema lecithinolyticum TaxID=53418 RepID=A0ABN0P2T3_TRELE|nr:ABC transporter, permease protein [Treponema lecithinolyticum ATCC 700332]